MIVETKRKEVLFVVNPISGIHEKSDIQIKANQLLDLNRFNLKFKFTEFVGHAEILARQAVLDGVDIVVAVGGDGTVNEVAKSLFNTSVSMAVIPCGSGNGLARHLKISRGIDEALRLLNDGKVCLVDTGTIAGRFFVGAAGLGFDALIASRFSTVKRRGFLTYAALFIRYYFSYEPKIFNLSNSGQNTGSQYFVFSFLNSSQYGNGTVISPKSVIDDGFLEVVSIKKLPFYLLPIYAYRLFRGTLKNDRYYNSFSVKAISVQVENALAHVDGESLVLPNAFEVKVCERSLWVVVAS